MSDLSLSPQEHFLRLVELMRYNAEVKYGADAISSSRGFGSSALKINDKIFAMVVRERLVLKLPRQRIDGLIEDGAGERLQMTPGRIMKEWFSLAPHSDLDWQSLAEEAMAFTASASKA
jgi:hypothetical protein